MNDEQVELMAEAAIIHVSMLYQGAIGQFKEDSERAKKRMAALIAYIRTGDCALSSDDKHLAQEIHQLVATHYAAQKQELSA